MSCLCIVFCCRSLLSTTSSQVLLSMLLQTTTLLSMFGTSWMRASSFIGSVLASSVSKHLNFKLRFAFTELKKVMEIFMWDRSGIQQRRTSWQDGVLGTNCPIPAKWNWTYQFQVKDQIGSFFYFPSLHLQRAAGGFGGFIINNRAIIPIPFDTPHGDIVVFIGDWYTRNHTVSVIL